MVIPFTEFYFAQVLGLISFTLGILCFYQRDDRRLKFLLILLHFNNAIHFALLSAFTSCLSSALAVLRTSISLKTSSKFIAYLFVLIAFFWGVYLSKHWYDMFPIIGSCIGTYVIFFLRGIPMRIGFLLGALCWLCNNIIVGSIGATLLELTLIVINLNTIRRMYNNNQVS